MIDIGRRNHRAVMDNGKKVVEKLHTENAGSGHLGRIPERYTTLLAELNALHLAADLLTTFETHK